MQENTYANRFGLVQIRYNSVAKAATPIINAADNAICDAVTKIVDLVLDFG